MIAQPGVDREACQTLHFAASVGASPRERASGSEHDVLPICGPNRKHPNFGIRRERGHSLASDVIYPDIRAAFALNFDRDPFAVTRDKRGYL